MMSGWDSFIVICPIIGLLTLTMVVLMHMLARALNLQSLTMWVKAEYAQVAVTFLLIGMAAVLQTAGNDIVSEITASVTAASGNIPLNSITVANLGDPVKISKAYISNVVECEKDTYYLLYVKNFFTEAYANLSFDALGVEAIAGGFALSGFVSLYHYVANNMIFLVLFNYIQYNIILFSQYTMLNIFLPMGLILRAFPATRGAGGLVTAFAFAFAFVFPMTYVLIIAMMPNINVFCAQVQVAAQGPDIVNQDPCLNNAGGMMEGYYKLKSQTGETTGLVDWIESNIGMMMLQAMFYPLVALTVAFTFMRQASSLMGSDLAEIGRGLIKLI
ncbi:Uncharacterised protein [uncultured archaeon]|nr:Uncharacterised protein [uncultured archaeon]